MLEVERLQSVVRSLRTTDCRVKGRQVYVLSHQPEITDESAVVLCVRFLATLNTVMQTTVPGVEVEHVQVAAPYRASRSFEVCPLARLFWTGYPQDRENRKILKIIWLTPLPLPVKISELKFSEI